MNLNKICPECDTEYLPNIETCADCGVKLLMYEEYRNLTDERKHLAEQALRNSVVVRKGDLKWLEELRTALIDSGIHCTIAPGEGCDKSRCSGEWQLLADKEDSERALARIEEYFEDMYPEMKASNELASQGKCPACGYALRPDATECPDCGLKFAIDEEEE